jgi:hypothetical protein
VHPFPAINQALFAGTPYPQWPEAIPEARSPILQVTKHNRSQKKKYNSDEHSGDHNPLFIAQNPRHASEKFQLRFSIFSTP